MVEESKPANGSRGPSAPKWLTRCLVLGALVACVGAYFGLGLFSRPSRNFEERWTSAAAAGFNVVVVTLDTTRADRLGCYGHRGASTPVLDQLAREGVRFSDAVSCVPMTTPAHASIFTGLDPPNHGVRSNGLYTLGPEYVTLAETLSREGYETAGFVSAFVLDARYGLSQGFDHYDDQVARIGGSVVAQRIGGSVTDAALQWLDARQEEHPFFLWVHYFDPHLGYNPPQPYAKQFAKNPYDGEIAYMDSQIGRLVDELSKGTGRNQTLMIVVGDHGESHGEHHESTHSRAIYDATQHIPLIMWAPGVADEAYLVDDTVVGIIDVYPTILELLGVETKVAVDGVGSIDGVSLLECRSEGNRALYLETMRTYLDHQWAPLFGLRRHTDKFILAPTPEYYELESDPHELNNRYAQLSGDESVAELAQALSGRIKRDPLEEAVAAAAAAVQPDQDALRRLQSLGYVSGGGAGDEIELPPDPKDMMPALELINKGRSLRQAGNLPDALARLREAMVESPNDRTALREVGTVYAMMGNAAEAERAFSRYLEIKPDADVCWTLAQVKMQTGRPDGARALLRQALELEPHHGGALVAMGDLAASEKQYDEALRLYEQAREVDPYRAKAMATKRIDQLRQQLENGS